MALSQYLSHCWFRISLVLRQSPENNFTVSAQAIILHDVLENHKISSTSPWGQWFKEHTFITRCTFTMNVDISYYHNEGNQVFEVFFDADKIINLCKQNLHVQWAPNVVPVMGTTSPILYSIRGVYVCPLIKIEWMAVAMMAAHDDVIKWTHFPRYWPFVRRIHRWPVNSPHKGQWRGAFMFFFYLRLNKRLSKQWWGWWFGTP